jgi:hypothetical protein
MATQQRSSVTQEDAPPPPYATGKISPAITSTTLANDQVPGRASIAALLEPTSAVAEINHASELGNSRESLSVEVIKYRALHDYHSETWKQLSIKRGEIVILISKCSDSSKSYYFYLDFSQYESADFVFQANGKSVTTMNNKDMSLLRILNE